MHYHCEIIMPPTDDIEAAVKEILEDYSERNEETDHGFYDWYVIGGRFSGDKRVQSYDKEKLDAFESWCEQEKITVSGVRAGKQEISPASQTPMVDEKWNELFPTTDGSRPPCPLFKHSNDQYNTKGLELLDGDILPLNQCKNIKCSRVIIAGKSWNDEGLDVKFMLCEEQWNGVNHMPIKWDGTISDALNQHTERIEQYNDEARQRCTPQDDWLVVTVDYHS